MASMMCTFLLACFVIYGLIFRLFNSAMSACSCLLINTINYLNCIRSFLLTIDIVDDNNIVSFNCDCIREQ